MPARVSLITPTSCDKAALRKKESQNGSPRRAYIWSSIGQMSSFVTWCRCNLGHPSARLGKLNLLKNETLTSGQCVKDAKTYIFYISTSTFKTRSSKATDQSLRGSALGWLGLTIHVSGGCLLDMLRIKCRLAEAIPWAKYMYSIARYGLHVTDWAPKHGNFNAVRPSKISWHHTPCG